MSPVEVGDVLGVVGAFRVPFGMYAECLSDAHVWGSLVLLWRHFSECAPRFAISRSVLRDMLFRGGRAVIGQALCGWGVVPDWSV